MLRNIYTDSMHPAPRLIQKIRRSLVEKVDDTNQNQFYELEKKQIVNIGAFSSIMLSQQQQGDQRDERSS